MAEELEEKIELPGDWKRTGYCGLLSKSDKEAEVILYGWVNRKRDLGKLIFIDLRDREGIVQLVIKSESGKIFKKAKTLKNEYVIAIKGKVVEREEKLKNPEMPTGDVEVEVENLKILNTSEAPPFLIDEKSEVNEELRLKYRYLDLRKTKYQTNLKLRHKMSIELRNFFNEEGFLEIETPFLTKSTPEGARDYLVPSRIYPGRFFALPQSPQIFKQILMISGFDKYFQLVRCFRDEDLRADRQPEFTQIDVEMSFPEEEDIFSLIERLMKRLFNKASYEIEIPFKKLSYTEAMDKYGSDKPDLRIPYEIVELTEEFKDSNINFLREKINRGNKVKGLKFEDKIILSRKNLDEINEQTKSLGGSGIFWIKRENGDVKSSLKLDTNFIEKLFKKTGENISYLLGICEENEKGLKILGELRNYMGKKYMDLKKDDFRLAWIKDFPLFVWSDEENKIVSNHHPFTSPKYEDLDLLEREPLRVKARAYDLVLNGVEIGGGSIRIHNSELQKRIFKVLGLTDAEMEQKFGFLIEALKYGAPPHGGIALGFDRIVMILAGEDSIREVIAFPKTTSSLCLMTDSPSLVKENQLKELGLKIIK
ncbi:MAG: aspartate--tRNA ligase [Acidobacteriota bacterium]